MARMNIYKELTEAKTQGKKKLAVLIDPDKLRIEKLERVIQLSRDANVDYFFVGGSLIVHDRMDMVLQTIRQNSNIPMVLFPGNSFQISNRADALLFLSLISGRNAELLIGKQVITAPILKESSLEIISTGYMLIDGGVSTTVSYMSNTHPIPANKPEVALCTALAGEMLGLKLIYMDAGSGAINPVTGEMIMAVSDGITIPLIVGGGIRSPEQALVSLTSGADALVIGTAFEKDPELIVDISATVHSIKSFA